MTLTAKRHSTYGSLPWGIYDEAAKRFIEVKRVNAAGEFRGYVANFARKMDAQAAIDAIIPEETK